MDINGGEEYDLTGLDLTSEGGGEYDLTGIDLGAEPSKKKVDTIKGRPFVSGSEQPTQEPTVTSASSLPSASPSGGIEQYKSIISSSIKGNEISPMGFEVAKDYSSLEAAKEYEKSQNELVGAQKGLDWAIGYDKDAKSSIYEEVRKNAGKYTQDAAIKLGHAQFKADENIGKLKEAIKGDIDYIGSNLNSFTRKSEEEDIIADEIKIDEYAKEQARKKGLPEDGYYKNFLYNNAKAEIAQKIIEPDVLKEREKLFKEKTGKTIDEAFGKDQEDFAKQFTKGEEIKAVAETQINSVAQEVNSLAKTETDSLAKEINAQVTQLNQSYQQQSSQVTDEAQANELYKGYTDTFNKLQANFLDAQNQINGKYNARLRRQADEIEKVASQKWEEEVGKYNKEYNPNPELLKQLQETSQEAYKKVVDGKNTVKEVRDLYAPPAVNLYRSTISSLGRSLGNISETVGYDYGKVLGDYMENTYQVGSGELKEWKDLLDASKLAKSSGQLIGAMLPSMAAAAATTIATEGMGAPAAISMLSGGLAAWTGESMDMAGNIERETFAATGDANKALERSKRMWDAQMAIMPLYALEGLPFMKGLSLSKNIGKRMAGGAVAEYVPEILQEYTQTKAEEVINKDKEFSQIFETASWKEFGHTALNVAPVIILGAGGQIRGEKSEQEQIADDAKAFAKKAEFADIAPDQRDQFLSAMLQQRGVNFTSAFISNLYTNGRIDKGVADELTKSMGIALEVQNKAKEYGLDQSQQQVFTAFKYKLDAAQKRLAEETDPILKQVAEQKVKELEEQTVNFASGKQADYVVLTYPNGEQYVLSTSQAENAAKNPKLIQSIKDGSMKIDGVGKGVDIVNGIADNIKAEKKSKSDAEKASLVAETGAFIQDRIEIQNANYAQKEAQDKAQSELGAPSSPTVELSPTITPGKEVEVSSQAEGESKLKEEVITPDGFTNRVFDSNLQLGEAPADAHLSEEGYNYRVLSKSEIDAIRESGGVFAREGKQKGGNKNTKYWTKGNAKNWYGDKGNSETIRVNQDKFKPNEVVMAEDVEVYNKETKQFEPLFEENSPVLFDDNIQEETNPKDVAGVSDATNEVEPTRTQPAPAQITETAPKLSEGRQFALDYVLADLVDVKPLRPKMTAEEAAKMKARKGRVEDGKKVKSIRKAAKDIGERIDWRMKNEERHRAIRDIKKGKYDTTAAKMLLDRLEQFHDNGYFDFIVGTGGKTYNASSVPIERVKEHLAEAKALKEEVYQEYTEEEVAYFAEQDAIINEMMDAFEADELNEQNINEQLKQKQDENERAKKENAENDIGQDVGEQEQYQAALEALAKRIEKLKQTGALSTIDFGITVSLYNAAIDLIAKEVRNGTKLGKAVAKAIQYIDSKMDGRKWNKGLFAKEATIRFSATLPDGRKVDVEVDKSKETAEMVNGWYSPLEQGILDAKIERATGKEWAKRISGATEADEMKWTGMEDFLNENVDKVLSKADIQQYLKDNRISVVEVVKSKGNLKLTENDWYEGGSDGEYTALDGELEIILGDDGIYTLYENGESLERSKDLKKLMKYEGETNKDTTKFSQHQLEGQKENYKEVLVTMPNKTPNYTPITELPSGYDITFDSRNNTYAVIEENQTSGKSITGRYHNTQEDAVKNAIEVINAQRKNVITSKAFDNQFRSSHFDEPNILVHLRINTRTDAQGNKILFLEELQSDFGQQGKKQGFKLTEKEAGEAWNIADKKYADFMKRMESKYGSEWESEMEKGEVEEETKLLDARENTKGGTIPQAPFVTDTNAWTKLGLKVALKEAVKQGADKIAWTTGEQQNNRYDLSKSVDELYWNPNSEMLYAYKNKGEVIKQEVPKEKLADFIGKDIAEKLLASPKKGQQHELKGEQLKIGGKGMKGFYGSPTEGSLGIVGNVAKNLFKQEPKTVEIDANERGKATKDFDDLKQSLQFEKQLAGKSKTGIVSTVNKDGSYTIEWNENKPSTQHSIDITPELRVSVEYGIPLFKGLTPDAQIARAKENLKKIFTGRTGKAYDITTLPAEALAHLVDLAIGYARKGGNALAEYIKDVRTNYAPLLKNITDADLTNVYNNAEQSIKEKTPTQDTPTTSNINDTDKGEGKGGVSDTQVGDGVEGDKKVHALGMRVIVSNLVDEETKKGFKEQGIEYIEKTRDISRKQAQDIINAYDKAGRLSELANHVIANSFKEPDVKVMLLKLLRDKYADLGKNTTGQESEAYKKRALDLHYEAMKYATQLGRAVNAFKEFLSITGQDPYLVVQDAFRALDGRNEAYFKKYEKSFEQMGKSFKDLLESEEGQELIKQRIAEEVEAQVSSITEPLTTERRKKADKAIAAIKKFKAKIRANSYSDATGIVAAVDTALTIIEKAIDSGATIADAVERGVRYVNKKMQGKTWNEEQFRKDVLDSFAEEGIKDTVEDKVRDAAKSLKKKLSTLDELIKNPDKALAELEKKKEKADLRKSKQAAKSDEVKAIEEDIKLKRKILKAVSDPNLNEKQKKQILGETLDSIIKNGYLSETAFKNIFAKAIGLEHLTEKDEQILLEGAQVISEVTAAEQAFNENPNEENYNKLQEVTRKGKIANEKISKYFRTNKTLADILTTGLRGNLLSFRTILLSGLSNIATMPLRTSINATSSGIDMLRYGLGKVGLSKVPLVGKYFGAKRTSDFLAAQKGYYKGFGQKGREAIKDLWTGALPDEVYEREMRSSLHPLESFSRIINSLNGKEKQKLTKNLLDATETLVGLETEGIFRLLNVTDKPFRGGTENAVLSELVTLKLNERKSELENKVRTPEEQKELDEIQSGREYARQMAAPEETIDKMAKDEGAKSVFQDKHIITKWLDLGAVFIDNHISDKLKNTAFGKVMKGIVKLLGATQMPFINMPLNWGTELFMMANPIVPLTAGVIKATQGDIRASNRYIAKALMGQMILNVGFWLIANGFINGSGDDDDKEKRNAVMKYMGGYNRINLSLIERYRTTGINDGWKKGDRTMEYYQLGMIGAVIAATANMYDKYGDAQMKQMDILNKSLNMIPQSARTALDMPMVQGTNQALNALTSGREDAQQRWLVNTSNALKAIAVPSTVIRGISASDKNAVTKQMQDENTIQWIKNNFNEQIGQGEYLPNKHDLWGNKILKTPKSENAWKYQLLDFTKGQTMDSDIFGIEIFNLMQRLEKENPELVKDVLPNKLPFKIGDEAKINGEMVKLTPAKYEELWQLTGAERRKLAGMYLQGTLGEVGSEFNFKNDSDAKRAETLKMLYEKAYVEAKNKFALLEGIKVDEELKAEEDIEADAYRQELRETLKLIYPTE